MCCVHFSVVFLIYDEIHALCVFMCFVVERMKPSSQVAVLRLWDTTSSYCTVKVTGYHQELLHHCTPQAENRIV